MLKNVFNLIRLSLWGEDVRHQRTGEGERLFVARYRYLFFFLFFLFTISCSGLGSLGGGSGLTGETSGSTTSEEGGATSTDGSSGTDTSPTDGSGEVMPTPVSMPSTLTIDKDKIIVATLDESGYTPAIGYEGAVDTSSMTDSDGDGYVNDYYVAVSGTSLEETSAMNHNSPLSPLILRGENQPPPLKLRGGWGELFITSAHAEDTTNYCTMDDITLAPIATDGSFEAYPTGTNSSSYYIYVTDCTNLSKAVTETPNKNFLWFREEPKDLAGSGTAESATTHYLSALTNDMGVQISEAGGTFEVRGNYTDSYLDFTATSAEQLAYDSSSTVALLEPTAGLSLFSDLYGDLTDTGTDVTVEDTERYNFLKYTADGKMRFSIKPLSPDGTLQGYIFVVPEDNSQLIKFLDSTSDVGMAGVQVANTLAFDVDSDGWAVVLFEDRDGGVRLRAGKLGATSSVYRFGGTTALTETITPLDLQIYYNNTSSADGKALVLDQTNNKLWQIDFNHEGSPSSYGVTFGDGISLGDGKTPVSWAFNSAKDTVYVLNQGDDTVSVVTIKDSSGNPLDVSAMSVSEISLADYLPGKNIDLTPNEIVYHAGDAGNYLVATAQGLKGALVMDLSTASMTTVTTGESTETETETTTLNRPARRMRGSGLGIDPTDILPLFP